MSTRDGLLRPVQRIYDATVRARLPRKLGVYNGVTVRQPRLLDFTDRHPDYEQANVDAIQQHVTDGDDVVTIGGGVGVTAVYATRQGPSVDVAIFEAAIEQVELIEETLEINGGGEQVEVNHTVVGDCVDPWGETTGADVLPPEDLPAADVLEIDAEGAELSILDGLNHRPRVLIVESHGHLGCPTVGVREAMERLGYEIVSCEPERAGKDVMVLTGVGN